MTETNLLSALEAVLFAAGEVMKLEDLARIFTSSEEKIQSLLEKLEENLLKRESGIMVRKVSGGFQLATRREYAFYIEKLAETSIKKLSLPALETLAIIAFKQPVTKQEVEEIRGVHIERVLARLLEMELITEVDRKDVIGRPILYGTTDLFLETFGLNDLKDLPPLTPREVSQFKEDLPREIQEKHS